MKPKSKTWTPKPKKAFGSPHCHFCNCTLPEGSRWTNCPKCHSTYNDEYSPLQLHTVIAKRKINMDILGPKKLPTTFAVIEKWKNIPESERNTGFACFYTHKQSQIPVQELTSYYHSEKKICDELRQHLRLFFLFFFLCVRRNTFHKKPRSFAIYIIDKIK